MYFHSKKDLLFSCSILNTLVFLIVFTAHRSVFAADYFATDTGSGSSCTQSQPCSLQTAVGLANDGDTVYVAGGAYGGTGDNVIEITDSINLLGGWDGSPTGSIVRDPEAYVTILDGDYARRVISIRGSGETPTIDGFTITNGNATGLVTDCVGISGDPNGCGGGIFVYQADPIISNNIINYNVAVGNTGGTSKCGYGGGIFAYVSYGIQIIHNTISDNIGNQSCDGNGGGISLSYCGDNSLIENNIITGNQATTYTTTGWGGAISLGHSNTLIQGNTIENNQASSTSAQGSGIFCWYSTAEINGNTITDNHEGEAVYLGYFDGVFEANRVLNNSTHTAVFLGFGVSGSATITNNIIEGTDTNTLNINDFAGDPLTAYLKHNSIIGKGAAYGVYIENYSTVFMMNNIVFNHSVSGVVPLSGATGYLTQNNTLFYGNTSNGELGTDYVIGDPAFRNSSEADYRIQARSAAKNAGIDAGVPDDIQGTPRPVGSGYDIGAYEFYPAINAGVLLLLLN